MAPSTPSGPAAVPVLMYHAVRAVPDGPLRTLAVPPAVLRAQLGALRQAGYRLVGLTEAVDLAGDADPPPRLVALTFDDGYADFLSDAVPVLAELGARATLYVPAAELGRPARWLGAHAAAFGPLLDWAGLAEVAAAGVEIGNHGLVHHPLDVLPADRRSAEIARGRAELCERLGVPVRSFCYPHGYHSRPVRDAVAAAGHDTACEIGYRHYRPGTDRYAIPRLMPTPDHRPADLLHLVGAGGDGRTLPVLARRAARPAWRVARRLAGGVLGRSIT